MLRALLEAGDELLLPDPAWPNFRIIAHLLGARVLPYPLVAEGDFLPRPEDLERLTTPRTRAKLVNSPSNPLGTEEILEVLGHLTEQSLVTVSFDTDGSRRSGVLTSSARSHSTRRALRSTGNWATDLGWRWY